MFTRATLNWKLQSPSPIIPVSGYLSGAQRHGRVHQADEGSYSQGLSADLCETTPPGSPVWDRPVSPLLPCEDALYSSMNVADRSPVSPTGSILYTSDSVYSGSHANSSDSYHSQAPGSPCSPAWPSYAKSFASPNHRYSAIDFEPMSYLKEPSYYVPPTDSHSGGKASMTSSTSEVPPSARPLSGTDYLPSSYLNEGTFVPPVSCHSSSSEGTKISSRWDLKSFANGAKSLYSKWTEKPRARNHGPRLIW
jgi:hypothetical protein